MKILKTTIILFCMVFTSCKTNYLKYESNWLINKFEINNQDFSDSLLLFNFEINTRIKKAIPPALKINNQRKKIVVSDINIFSKGGKDYIEFKDHYFFKGVYEMNCIDQLCCTMEIKNDGTEVQLIYNGDLPFGISRDCDHN